MDLVNPRPKKYCRLQKNIPLPLVHKKNGSLYQFHASFNGFSVVIEEEEDMKNIISMGYFGKGNFSRSYPQFNQNKTEILRNRQYTRRKEWGNKFSNKNSKKVIVVPDSDEEGTDYFTDLRPEYQIDMSGVKETVSLSLEEAFFLQSALTCLSIYFESKIINSEETWRLFSETDPHFQQNYIVYYHFRAKQWVVKPGIKFGGDFLLYVRGPPFYHASYVVIIDSVNEKLERIQSLSRRSMDNTSLLNLNRLCETAGKELLICQIIWPANGQMKANSFLNFRIKEILMRRWISTQERKAEELI